MKRCMKPIKLFSLFVLVLFIISTQALTVSAAQIVKLDTSFSSYNVNLFDTGYISYSIQGDQIAYGNPTNEIVLAVDTTNSMKYAFDENYDYTAFLNYAILSLSEEPEQDGLFIEGSEGYIYGNIHSNNNLKAQYGKVRVFAENSVGDCKTDETNAINGRVEASGETINWPYYTLSNSVIQVTNAPKIKFPDIGATIKNDPETMVYETSQVFKGQSAVFDSSIYVDGDLEIQTESVVASGLIAAKGNIRIGTQQASLNSPLCVYSETGNITLANEVGSFKGVVIAPNGTVRIEASTPTVNGRIVGKKVDLHSAILTVDARETNSYITPILKYIEKETRLYKEKQIVKSFIDSYVGNSKTKIGVVSYAENAEIVSNLTEMTNASGVSTMKSRIDNLKPSGEIISNPDGTLKSSRRNIGDAMRRAYYMLKNSSDPRAAKYVIVLTDEVSNVWTCNSISDPTYKRSDGDSTHEGWDSTGSAKEYGKIIGTELIQNSGYKSFFIALPGVALSSDRTSAETQLTEIAGASGANTAPGGKLFYSTSAEAQLSNALNSIKSNIPDAIEYPNELPFQSVSFYQVFPKGVKVLSAQYGSNDMVISYDGQKYTVSGNLSGLKLVKNSYTGMYQLSAVPGINIKVRYNSFGQGTGVWNNGVLNSSITISGGTVNYKDYFGMNASAVGASYTIGLRYFADIS